LFCDLVREQEGLSRKNVPGERRRFVSAAHHRLATFGTQICLTVSGDQPMREGGGRPSTKDCPNVRILFVGEVVFVVSDIVLRRIDDSTSSRGREG
jgi:hypothetical protein